MIGFLRDSFPGAGLGDDAAVLEAPGAVLLFASDAVVEGVHFRLDFSTLSQVLQKVVTANVSDVYAMGGQPAGIVCSAGLPPGCGREELASIVDGLRRACEAYRLRLCGGDTVLSPGGYFFDVAVIGSLPPGGEPLRRAGARPGDALVVFGALGGALAGLRILEGIAGGPAAAGPLAALVPRGEAARALRDAAARFALDTGAGEVERLCAGRGLGAEAAAAAPLVQRHLCPRAALPAALESGGGRRAVRAAIDISDGLGKDLAALCRESGVGAVIDADAVPVPAALSAALGGARGALAFVLGSGEEYVLLAAVSDPGAVGAGGGAGAAVIGEVVEAEAGISVRGAGARAEPLRPNGYEHEF